LRLDRVELLRATGASQELLDDLESFHLITSRGGLFESSAVRIVALAESLARYGIDGRHLRLLRSAADRDLALVRQAVAPLRRVRNISGDAQDVTAGHEIATLLGQLHTTMITASLDDPER
jgi:hypothetical protein